MNIKMKAAGISLAAIMLAGSTGAALAQAGATVCYAFQDLSTGFWVAGHGAIVETLEKAGVKVVELNGGHDANRQLEQVKDCIAQGGNGVILTADDGDSGTVVVAAAQEADVPIATFNRPPSDMSKGIIVVADNEAVARAAVDAMVDVAKAKMAKTGKKLKPLILMGALADPNAVQRRAGFFNSVEAHPDLFEKAVEVVTDWNSQVALANLEAAMTADPDVDFIFTSSDFLFPTIKSVLEPLGKWKTSSEDGHVILGGLDGDDGACKLIQDGYVDSTGVQDVYLEAQLALTGILDAIKAGDTQPNAVKLDPGFALSQANFAEKGPTTWGCQVLAAAK
ncbi:MAG: sugar ABC transporter substrate-binding protein [Devosia sp.]